MKHRFAIFTAVCILALTVDTTVAQAADADAMVDEIFQQFGGGQLVQPGATPKQSAHDAPAVTKEPDAGSVARSAAATAGTAQEMRSTAKEPNPGSVAQPGSSADEIVRDADEVINQLNAGHYDDVWRGMPSFVRAQMQEQQFVQHTREVRERLGSVTGRHWVGVTRLEIKNAKGAPDGLYANADYVASLADGNAAYERLTFRLEDDGHWHLTGYVAKPAQVVSNGQRQ